jgi:type II secretory pathway component PulM
MGGDLIAKLRARLAEILGPALARARAQLGPLYAQARARYQSLQPRERILVQVAAAMVGVLLLYNMVYLPIVSLGTGLDQSITERERDLSDVRRLAGNYGQLKIDLAAAEHATVPQSRDFSLFSVVETALTKSVGRERISSITPSADRKLPGGLIQYSVQLKLNNVSLAQVVDALYGVRTITVPVAVSDLRVQRRSDNPHAFDVDMTCVALGHGA